MSNSRMHKAWSVPLIAGVLALGGIPALAGSASAAESKAVQDDFNGDGYKDLAVGAPTATIGGKPGAGYVTVMYGGPHGLTKDNRVTISRSTSGIPGDPAAGENFGYQLSTGDLDGDGRTDLIIGQASSTRDAVVVWGAKEGLSGGVSVPAATTQAGDFDGDTWPDLVLFRGGRAPGDDPLGTEATVWRGPISRDGKPTAVQDFGSTKVDPFDVMYAAAGDVNGDGRDDLALTVYTGDGGVGSQLYLSNPSGGAFTYAASPEGSGQVAFGDVNHDGYGDLVRGVPNESTVTVALGSASGLKPQSTWKSYSQDTADVPGGKEEEDRFGDAVAAGDVNGDGYADVAVGAPGEMLGDKAGAGMVNVLYGSRDGLTGKGSQGFTQDTEGVPGAAESGDNFGAAVNLLDINGNAYADLAAAAPRENMVEGGNSGEGAVWSLRGRPTGIVTDAAFTFGPRTVGAPIERASFGGSLS
ncbi:FG-GAP-like repeat-containing protein [Streptomyces pseudovenezuelae]|uniref:FG-GAP-like repeat-containing protein n=1 Tax=Streptomyces pseudovenezuelae TaxID=67350 RepID=UPI002E824BC1|nr:FG-GAP-like repeat-containing protein [Streptomyces pseudovenezuelae]WUA89081.1 FG-GAP-like repeat-containing protein [Streptomyces pseudovenezuelae]